MCLSIHSCVHIYYSSMWMNLNLMTMYNTVYSVQWTRLNDGITWEKSSTKRRCHHCSSSLLFQRAVNDINNITKPLVWFSGNWRTKSNQAEKRFHCRAEKSDPNIYKTDPDTHLFKWKWMPIHALNVNERRHGVRSLHVHTLLLRQKHSFLSQSSYFHLI